MYFDASTFHAAGDIAIDITSHYHLHVGTLVGGATHSDYRQHQPEFRVLLHTPGT